ncbi:uncharacterized protein LOC126313299 [Schistocerca gregaria]|uniref:uncharacterized protein LOC126313299 n=1 Tax=Schistocerca gregaria TaxID=7010 RepID=UPI00211ECC8D|nr:uncharacterized protein LOC126313299 [Schistocerca gregaria]
MRGLFFRFRRRSGCCERAEFAKASGQRVAGRFAVGGKDALPARWRVESDITKYLALGLCGTMCYCVSVASVVKPAEPPGSLKELKEQAVNLMELMSRDRVPFQDVEMLIGKVLNCLDRLSVEEVLSDLAYVYETIKSIVLFYQQLGNIEIALNTQERFLRFCERVDVLQVNPAILVAALNEMGDLLLQGRQFAKAKAYFVQTIEIARDIDPAIISESPSMLLSLSAAYGFLALSRVLSGSQTDPRPSLDLQYSILQKILECTEIQLSQKVTSMISAVNTHLLISAAYIEEKKKSEAIEFFELADSLCHQCINRSLHDQPLLAKLSLLNEHLRLRFSAFLTQIGELDRAEALTRELINYQTNTYGSNAIQLITSLTNLGVIRYQQKRYPDALDALQSALELAKKVPQPEKWIRDTQKLHTYLAQTFQALSNFEMAEFYLSESLDLVSEAYGDDSEQAAEIYHLLGKLSRDQKSYEKSLKFFQASYSLCNQILAPSHPLTHVVIDHMAEVMMIPEVGRLEEAEELLRKSLSDRRKAFDGLSPQVISCVSNLANLYLRRGDFEKAEFHFSQLLRLSVDKHSTECHRDVALAEYGIARSLMGLSNPNSREHLERALKIQKSLLQSAGSERSAADVHLLGCILYFLGRWHSDARHWRAAYALYEEALTEFEKANHESSPNAIDVQVDMARVLIGQKDYFGAQRRLDRVLKDLAEEGSQGISRVDRRSIEEQIVGMKAQLDAWRGAPGGS